MEQELQCAAPQVAPQALTCILGPSASAMLALSAPMRYGAAAVLVAPAGFFMGGAFPMAVRLVGERSNSSIPWLWAVNGAFSVQASVLAMMLSIAVGFKICFLAAAYAMAAIVGLKFLPVTGRGGALPPPESR